MQKTFVYSKTLTSINPAIIYALSYHYGVSENSKKTLLLLKSNSLKLTLTTLYHSPHSRAPSHRHCPAAGRVIVTGKTAAGHCFKVVIRWRQLVINNFFLLTSITPLILFIPICALATYDAFSHFQFFSHFVALLCPTNFIRFASNKR